jgi:cobalt-precorrin 5A hydrolase
MEPLLSTKSDYIFNTVGVYGVAESAALLAAENVTGTEPELVLNKIKNAKATCALARGFVEKGGLS